MPAISRATQKQFGSSAGASEVGQFGSRADGSPVYTSNPETIQALAAFLGGWYDAVLLNNSPAIQDMNALFVLAFYQLSYILQAGVPEWDDGTTYFTNNIVSSAGVLYVSRTDDNLNNAVSNTTHWKLFTTPEGNVNVAINPAVTPTRTLNASDNGKTFLVNSANGAFALTLPAASDGFSFTVKDVGGSARTNAITITRAGSESIEGVAANFSASKNWGGWSFNCNGTNWFITESATFTRLANPTAAGDVLVGGSSSDAGPYYEATLNVDPSTKALTFGASGVSNIAKGNILADDTNFFIGANSSDGSDSKRVQIGGGGAAAATRGAFIDLHGNEFASNAGRATYAAGNAAGAAGTNYAHVFTGAASGGGSSQDLLGLRGDGITDLLAGGIKFLASQVASSDANVLDDYEEGSFTPTLSYPTPGTSSFTYVNQRGNYIKIGARVFFSVYIELSAFSKGTATGSCQVSNLPFTSSSGSSVASPIGSMVLVDWPYSNIPVSRVNLTNILLNEQASNAGLGNITDPDSNSQIFVTGQYTVA